MKFLIVFVAAFTAALAAVPVNAATTGAYPRPGVTVRVSVASDGAQANGPSGLEGGTLMNAAQVSVSADGRYVAFDSAATNLVPGQPSPTKAFGNADAGQVFVHDLDTGRTVMASVSSTGAPGAGNYCAYAPTFLTSPVPGPYSDSVGAPSISGDGRYVAFASCYSNLVPSDTNFVSDVFVHDLRTGATTRVSVTSEGKQTPYSSWDPSISDSGRIVVFSSEGLLAPAADSCTGTLPSILALVGYCSDGTQVYAHDMQTGRTVLVSAAPDGAAGNGVSYSQSVSPDGRYVVFYSDSTNLLAGQTLPTNSPFQAYLRDLARGTTQLLSVGIDGKPSNEDCGNLHGGHAHEMSSDDRYVVFICSGTNLVPNYGPPQHGTNTPWPENDPDVYVRDLRTDRTERVSVNSTGGTLLEDYLPSISGDGRFVTFFSGDDDSQWPDHFQWQEQVFEHDDATGATDMVSVPPDGSWVRSLNQSAYGSDMNANGQYVAFIGVASDLVSGDTNGYPDVFERDMGTPLGVGGVAGTGRPMLSGVAGFASSGIVSAVAAKGHPTLPGSRLIAASMTYRPRLADLFVREELQNMPAVSGTPVPGILYGFDLTADGVHYQVRVQRVLGLSYDQSGGASFALFREVAAGLWFRVATLRGGYGTTGEEVVFALPLRDVGLRTGGRLASLTAFTALGGFVTGPVQVLDRVVLGG